MCGIVGQLNFTKKPVNLSALKKMANAISYRGPDGQGYYAKGQIGLGHRRLAIIDLKTGSQPIFNEKKNIVVILNGEIYNYQVLRAELEKRHRFVSQSDTETIVHLYEEYGSDFLQALNGDFALALWDQTKKKLIIARDRLGVKPLFFYQNINTFIFGSEIKAILANPEIDKPELNETAVDNYFSYLYIPGRQTIYRSISKLLPGEYLVTQNENVKIKQYWKPNSKINNKQNFYLASGEFKRLLSEAVRCRMIADVPVGIFLSGGLDSSALVATAANLGFRLETFSINCGQGYYNELPWARIIAKKFKTKHHEFNIKPNFINEWRGLIKYFDEPYGNSSALPTYLISKLASSTVKVALSGEGSDELLAGYSWQRTFENSLRIPCYRRFKGLPKINNQIYEKLRNYSPTNFKDQIFSGQMKIQPVNLSPIINQFDNGRPLESALISDLTNSLPEELLAKLDRTTLANSVEGRVPFLDHELVEFLSALPYSFKHKKKILKNAFREELPPEILSKPKQGMTVPIGDWLRSFDTNKISQIINSSNSKIDYLFNRPGIERIYNQHLSGQSDWGLQLFAILSFKLWAREHL